MKLSKMKKRLARKFSPPKPTGMRPAGAVLSKIWSIALLRSTPNSRGRSGSSVGVRRRSMCAGRPPMLNVEVVRCAMTFESDQWGDEIYKARRAAALSVDEAASLLGIQAGELEALEAGTSEPTNVTYADIVAEYRRAAEA